MKDCKESKKKSLKGMTLVEIIIAMIVLFLISSMLAVTASGIVSNIRTSKSVVEKVNYQSGYIVSNSGTNKTELKFSLSKTPNGAATGSVIKTDMYEAPEDAAGKYAYYDKAGNLKYFEYHK